MQSVGSCLFVFLFFLLFWFFVFLVFWFFGVLVFWFFGFLVFWFFGFLVWIAIADVPSRDCQALSVVALEARGMEFNFVRLRHMLLDLCTGNAAIGALPQWPVLKKNYCNNLQMNQMNMECYSSLWCFSSYFLPNGWQHLFQPLHLLFQHGSHCVFRNFAELCVVLFSHANHKVVLRT